ncbi:hypothetical protein QTP88_025268 [Uroleucon formosanum]
MDDKLRRFDDINEELTIGDQASLLVYAIQFAGRDYAYDILQPDDNSKAGTVETIRNAGVVTPTAQEAEKERSGKAKDVTPARVLESSAAQQLSSAPAELSSALAARHQQSSLS